VRVLWLTNDLPPRAGGIEQFVDNLLQRVHPERSLVLGPAAAGAAAHDRRRPYRTVRLERSPVLPTPSVLRAVRDHAGSHRPDVIVLGATWPLGELAPYLRDDPGVPVVGLTHGLEAGLAGVGAGLLIRRATRGLAAVTTISAYTSERLRPHLRAGAEARLPPGVDTSAFHPGVPGAGMRSRWGIPPAAPLVGCVSRLVKRKGQDALLDVWPDLRHRCPDAWLVLAGEGPQQAALQARVRSLGPGAQVVLAGRIDWADLAAAYSAMDVFAMPCRTRLFGTDVEGLGIVYLEAQACGVPAITGRSGGAPETVRDGETGIVVDGRDRRHLRTAIASLLTDPERRQAMGSAGRAWVEGRWSWEIIADRFAALLGDVAGSATPRE
jgi:phosphatidyl-myo-inositol dimannoside synthase